MTSHVEQQIAARIAAAKEKTQQQREERATFARQRAAGIERRKAAKLKRVFCGTCARPHLPGAYLRCPLGCGTALCNSAGCGNTHLRQCPNRGDTTTVAQRATTGEAS